MSLRRKLAEHGFESNEDYQFAVDCLFARPPARIRCLNVTGGGGRRKTAFATALVRALAYPRILYHDFLQPDPPAASVRVEGLEVPPLPAFDRAVIEACGFSEGEPAALILDQLQAAPFREHLRLHRFLESCEWPHPQGVAHANPRHLVVLLISEEPLYHALHRLSFRVHTDRGGGAFEHRPEDFGLDAAAEPLFAALAALFARIGVTPTASEMRLLLADLLERARAVPQIRQAIFGRVEGVPWEALLARELEQPLEQLRASLFELLGAEEIRI